MIDRDEIIDKDREHPIEIVGRAVVEILCACILALAFVVISLGWLG